VTSRTAYKLTIQTSQTSSFLWILQGNLSHRSSIYTQFNQDASPIIGRKPTHSIPFQKVSPPNFKDIHPTLCSATMDPSGPAQPPLNAAYHQPSNPTSQTDSEKQFPNSTSASKQRSDPTVEERRPHDIPVPSTHSGGGMPSSLGYGARDSNGDAGDKVSSVPYIAF